MTNSISAPGAAGPMYLELLDGDGPSGTIHGAYTINGGAVTNVDDVGAVTGTGFADTFVYKANLASNGFSLSSLDGGAGLDTLKIEDGHLFDLAYVQGVERIETTAGGIVLGDANFIGVASNQIYVKLDQTLASAQANLDASSLNAGHSVYVEMLQGAGSSAVTVTAGAGNDTFVGDFLRLSTNVIHGGQGQDLLYLQTARSTVQPFNADGFEYIAFTYSGSTSLQLTAANFVDVSGGRITVDMGTSGGTVDGSTLNASQALWLIGSPAAVMIGGAGADTFAVTANAAITGGAGVDNLITTGGLLGQATGVEYVLLTTANGTLLFADNAFTGVSGYLGARLTNGGTLDGSAVQAGHSLFLIASQGTDTITGGAGDDIIQIETAALSMFDVIKGGAGHDTLLMTQSDVVNVTGVSGVEFYALGDGAINNLVLSNANMVGVNGAFGVRGGADGNTIDGSAIVGKTQYLFGGAGMDTLRGGGGADVLAGYGGADTLFGGGAADSFAVAPGGAHVQDFHSGQDMIFFSDALFNLGAHEGTGAGVGFDRLDPSLYSTAGDGSFTTAGQRFSFDTVTHELFYAEQGSLTAPGSVLLLAYLDGVSSLSANDLFFGA